MLTLSAYRAYLSRFMDAILSLAPLLSDSSYQTYNYVVYHGRLATSMPHRAAIKHLNIMRLIEEPKLLVIYLMLCLYRLHLSPNNFHG